MQTIHFGVWSCHVLSGVIGLAWFGIWGTSSATVQPSAPLNGHSAWSFSAWRCEDVVSWATRSRRSELNDICLVLVRRSVSKAFLVLVKTKVLKQSSLSKSASCRFSSLTIEFCIVLDWREQQQQCPAMFNKGMWETESMMTFGDCSWLTSTVEYASRPVVFPKSKGTRKKRRKPAKLTFLIVSFLCSLAT